MPFPSHTEGLLQDVLALPVLGLAQLSPGDRCATCQMKLSAFTNQLKWH